MRRTAPVAVQVVPPLRKSNALLQARLIDFDTGSATPESQHVTWLGASIARAKSNSSYHIQIYGFASKLGDAAYNKTLSLARMNEVMKVIKRLDGAALNNLEMFEAFGEKHSTGAENDDGAEWRAVEVHIFIGDMPPDNKDDPPKGKKVIPRELPPLPGGPRYGRWEVAAPGGATFTVGPSIGVLTAGVTFGANFFAVRNTDTRETRNYAAIAAGLGASLGLPNMSGLKNALQTFLTGPNFSNLSFTAVFPKHAVTFAEVEASLVTVLGTNGGVGISVTAAVITFSAPGVYQYGPSGVPLKIAEDIWSFNSSGQNYQLGAGLSAVTGPLVRL